MSEPVEKIVYTGPDWSKRLPGEQWTMLDSVEVAEAYLAAYNVPLATIVREDFPNAEGLYARIRFADRITENRIFLPVSAD